MMITFINITVKHNNLLNLIMGCLYVSFFGLHVSVILMTIIRSIRAKEITRIIRNKLMYTDVSSVTFFGIFFPLTSFTNKLQHVVSLLSKVGVNKLMTDGEC